MPDNNNVINTRIQLKRDTKENWLSHPIVPLAGELIIYTADEDFPYPRLKVGDGVHNTTELTFVDPSLFTTTQATATQVIDFDAGAITSMSISNNVLNISNGSLPVLLKQDLMVISNIEKEEIVT